MISRKKLYKKIDKEVDKLFEEAKKQHKEGHKLSEQNTLGCIAGLLLARRWIRNHRFTTLR
ncbi:MAG: hypothetical protein ACFFCM_07470 [Promethearchaeota archaeon]